MGAKDFVSGTHVRSVIEYTLKMQVQHTSARHGVVVTGQDQDYLHLHTCGTYPRVTIKATYSSIRTGRLIT